MLPLLQEVAAAAPQAVGPHPLSGTVAQWLWLVPVLPFLDFLINGALSLSAAFHLGPDDPSASHGEHGHDQAHADDGHGAPGDDHHPAVRHKSAGLVSIVGPGVLVLSFIVTFMIWMAMRAAGGGEMAQPFV